MIMYREVQAMNKAGERLYNGIIKENPTFVLMLGMCPTLAVTTSAMNGLGMGLTTAVVLTMSNLIISLLRKVIPSRVRIPAFIVIIAEYAEGLINRSVFYTDYLGSLLVILHPREQVLLLLRYTFRRFNTVRNIFFNLYGITKRAFFISVTIKKMSV